MTTPLLPRAESQLRELLDIAYRSGQDSAVTFASAKVDFDSTCVDTYAPGTTTGECRMCCGDGYYSDNNGIAHLMYSYGNATPPLVVVAHVIDMDAPNNRNETLCKETQRGTIESYTRPGDAIHAVFQSCEMGDTAIHQENGRVNMVVTPTTYQMFDGTAIAFIFVGFVRETASLPMLPTNRHETLSPCELHKQFARESHRALNAPAVVEVFARVRAAHPTARLAACVAGGGMKTFTAGLTLLEYVKARYGCLHHVCGVSGGSWGMMYHLSAFREDLDDLDRVLALIDLVEARWERIVLTHETDIDEEASRKITALADFVKNVIEKLPFLTQGQSNYLHQVIRVVGERYDCDWKRFVSSWLFEGHEDAFEAWQKARRCIDTRMTFGCTAFAQGHIADTVMRRSRVDALRVAGQRELVRQVGKRGWVSAVGLGTTFLLGACNKLVNRVRGAPPARPYPVGLLVMNFDRDGLEVFHPTVSVTGQVKRIGDVISPITATSISSAAAAMLASNRYLERLLEDAEWRHDLGLARNSQSSVFPYNYPAFIICLHLVDA